MKETPTSARPKLSVKRPITTEASLPDPIPSVTQKHDAKIKESELTQTSPVVSHSSNISAILDPVCKHLGIPSENTADLAAFARKMLSGSKFQKA